MGDEDPRESPAELELEVPVAGVHRVPCPGVAHKTGGSCLVCDPETEGTIEVFLTGADLLTLRRAARGLHLDASLALRLLRLGLLEEIEGAWVPTREGSALLGKRDSRA